VWEESRSFRIWVRDKIRRLEFVSNKIEGRDSKMEVICICFSYPTKKNELVWGSPWDGSHDRSWSSMAGHGELAKEGKEGEGGGRGGAARVQLGHQGEGCYGGARWLLLCSSMRAFCTWENNWSWGRRRGGKREEKENEGKEKKKKEKKENFPNLNFFGGRIKDNLWSW
jgi:hypothetical protein